MPPSESDPAPDSEPAPEPDLAPEPAPDSEPAPEPDLAPEPEPAPEPDLAPEPEPAPASAPALRKAAKRLPLPPPPPPLTGFPVTGTAPGDAGARRQRSDTEPPPVAHVLLALLTALVLGAIALSLWTAPPVAPEQLHAAAQATVAAPGFVLTDVNSVTALITPPPGSAPNLRRTQMVHVLYQAPDRVQETGPGPTGGPVEVVVIGSDHWARAGHGPWQRFSPSPGLGAEAAQTVLSPLQGAADATVVVRHGDVYRFLPPDLDRFVATLLGTSPAQLSSLRITATVTGEYVTGERISGVLGRQRLEVDITLSSVGDAPPVTAPPGV